MSFLYFYFCDEKTNSISSTILYLIQLYLFIFVKKGRLFIGAENCPALGQVSKNHFLKSFIFLTLLDNQYEVVLDGEPAYKVDPDGFGTKVLAGFPGSHIDIHGR